MLRKTRLFTPGPTSLLPAAQLAMAAASMHHRSDEFHALYTRVLGQLKEFVGTKNDVVMLAASGTGAMEASVSNLTSPGDRVLVLSAGLYGDRWVSLAQNFGCAVDVIRKPYGETFDPDEVKKALKLETRCVFMQASETSTGTAHDAAGVGRLLQQTGSEALLVVDAISAIGTMPLDMEEAGIDVLIGASQTTLMVPPGVSFLSLNEKAWDRMEATYNPRYYFDLRRERKNARKGESAFTPAVALIAATGAALDFLAAQSDGDLAAGRAKLVHNAAVLAEMTRAACAGMGFKLLSASPAASCTAIVAPDGLGSDTIVSRLKTGFGVEVSDGQGEMKGRIVRVAHMGFIDAMDTMALIAALEHVAVDLNVPGVNVGDGLIAAQTVLAQTLASKS